MMVGTEQEDEQRLRAAAGDRRSPHLRGDESSYGEAFGSLMRLFRQFLDGVLRSSPVRHSKMFSLIGPRISPYNLAINTAFE